MRDDDGVLQTATPARRLLARGLRPFTTVHPAEVATVALMTLAAQRGARGPLGGVRARDRAGAPPAERQNDAAPPAAAAATAA
jgi:hypothetical protein